MSPPVLPHARPARLLGIAGLLPFAGLALGLLIFPERSGALGLWLRGYGAVILSFVGALHWAFALRLPPVDHEHGPGMYGWSVVPALLAWVSLALPVPAALGLQLVGFLAQAGFDARLTGFHWYPAWFWRLRMLLTAVVCASLGLSAILLWMRG